MGGMYSGSAWRPLRRKGGGRSGGLSRKAGHQVLPVASSCLRQAWMQAERGWEGCESGPGTPPPHRQFFPEMDLGGAAPPLTVTKQAHDNVETRL